MSDPDTDIYGAITFHWNYCDMYHVKNCLESSIGPKGKGVGEGGGNGGRRRDSDTRFVEQRAAIFPIALPLSLLMQPAGMVSIRRVPTNPSTSAHADTLPEPT